MPWQSHAYRAITHNLLGKSLDDVLPESMVLNERMLYNLNMGYYSLKTRTPHSSVAYFPNEHKFYHPWSLHAQSRTFGYNRIKEIMSLKDFMTMPSCVVDEMIEGIIEGETARFDAEKDAADDQTSAVAKAQKELIKQLGLDKALK